MTILLAVRQSLIKKLIFFCMLISAIVVAEDAPSPSPECDDTAKLQRKSEAIPTVDKINIHIHPIFDKSIPEENNFIFRTINYLHINTRESVIKNDLLFDENDPYDEKLLQESERILRVRRYLSEASIATVSNCTSDTPNKKIDVDVHEVWTLIPILNFSHAGGKSSSGFGVRDSNFLGFGKTVNIKHSSDAERSGNLFQYYDPNTGVADSTFGLDYANNSDGVYKSTALIKPFVALSTNWSAGISYETLNEEDTLYNAGKEVDRFAHDSTNSSIFFGIKLNEVTSKSVQRISVGYTSTENNFSAVALSPLTSTFIPDDRQLKYPWLEYQHVTDGFIKTYNINQINRVEDINLGASFRVRLGYTTSTFDAYDKSTVINSEYSQAFSLSANQLVLAEATADGYYAEGEFYNSQIKADGSYHWQNFKHGQFFVRVTTARGFQLFKDIPLELGGDTGLRGYPARYQAGDHLQLVTVEQRFFGEKEWFSLFHLGAAVFYDQGRVWGESAISQSQQTWLRDFGIGLRISGTRTGNREEGAHNVVHIDVATPLDGGKDISKVQWIVKVKQVF